MSFMGKANAGMAKFSKSMKDGMDNCRTDGKIAEQQKIIKELTKEIGNLTLLQLESGVEMSPEIMERYLAVKDAKEKIVQLENDKKVTSVLCQECGAKTKTGMKYCGKCGAQLNNV